MFLHKAKILSAEEDRKGQTIAFINISPHISPEFKGLNLLYMKVIASYCGVFCHRVQHTKMTKTDHYSYAKIS